MNEQDYTPDTLKTLTWDNLGYRLGKLFGETSDELIEKIYNWCVEQQKQKPNF